MHSAILAAAGTDPGHAFSGSSIGQAIFVIALIVVVWAFWPRGRRPAAG